MAEFAKPLPTANDPSYIGYSRQTQGDRSASDLIKNVGNIFTGVVNARDEAIKEQLKADIKSGIAGGTAEKQTVTAKADDTETVDVFGEQRLAANPEVGKRSKTAQKLTDAYAQGKISATQYWGRMSTISKELKARYPGYSDEIDRQFQGITGQIPATALANAKRREYTSHLAKVNDEEKSYHRFIQRNIGYLPPDYYERAQSGDPYGKLEVYQRVHRLKSAELAHKYEKDQLAMATSRGNLNEENAVGVAQNEANMIVDTAIADVGTQKLINQITEAQTRVGQGGSISPQEKTQIRAAMGLLKARVRSKVEKAMRAPNSDGSQTYYSIIKDPAKVQKVVDASLAPITEIESLLDDDEYGLFALGLNQVKAAETDTQNELLKIPMFNYLNAVKKTGGGDIAVQLAYERTEFNKHMSTAIKSSVDVLNNLTIAGEQKPLIEKVQQVNRAAKADANSGKAGARKVISDAVTMLTSPQATETSKTTTAVDMFGPGNGQFLRHFSPTTQIQLYDELVSPAVTREMSKVRETRPDLWENYKDWAYNSFIALQSANAASIQEGIASTEDVQVTWNPDSNQFVTNLTTKGAQRAFDRSQGQDTLLSGVDDKFADDVRLAVKNFNRQIKAIENIVKVEGGDVTKEIQRLVAALNITPMQERQRSIFQKFRNLLDDAVKESDKEKSAE